MKGKAKTRRHLTQTQFIVYGFIAIILILNIFMAYAEIIQSITINIVKTRMIVLIVEIFNFLNINAINFLTCG